MSRYTASPFGIVPEYISDLKNFKYTKAGEAVFDKDPETGVQSTKSQESLFSSSHKIIRTEGDNEYQIPVNYDPKLHEDEGYDLTTTNIIKQLSDKSPAMKLKYADFAYCRDFGVYPNNRLIICRKFGGPVGDDLNLVKSPAVSTVISWFDEASLPVSIDFGVNFDDAEGSFKNVLNNMGKDVGLDKVGIQLGDVATKGFNFLPLPGIFEPFTKGIINNIFGDGTVNPNTVSGAPNLIKEAKQRKLITDDTVGSGLIGKITVSVKCSWEQKFIMGQDPTHVYFDLLRTILHFGGEDGTFYAGGNAANVVKKFLDILNNPVKFIQDILAGLVKSITKIIDDVSKLIKKFFDEAKIKKSTSEDDDNFEKTIANKTETEKQVARDARKAEQTKKENAAVDATNKGQDTLANKVTSSLKNLLQIGTSQIGNKYKHVLLGIVSALTGQPSTPWHVTIGNPLKPIFSCGDLYTSGVKLTLGPTLAFNDLPSTIDIEFTLTSGRNYGIGEIFRKLTTGDVRIQSKSAPSFYNDEGVIEENTNQDSGAPINDGKDISDGLQPYEVNSQSKVDSVNAVGPVSTNAAQINPDPYSNPVQAPIQNTDPNGGFTDEELAAMAKEDAAIIDQAAVDQNARIDKAFEERVEKTKKEEAEEDRLNGITKPVEEPPQPWVPGKSAHAGGQRNQQGIRIAYNVFNGTTPGTFTVKWDLADTVYTEVTGSRDKRTGGQAESAPFNSISEAMEFGRQKIEPEFLKALANKGLTPI